MNQNKLIFPLIFLAMFAIAFILTEPFITKPRVKEEFYMITKETVEKDQVIEETKSNGLIAIFETKEKNEYRVSYKRWGFLQLWKKDQLIGSIEKKQENTFTEIHKK